MDVYGLDRDWIFVGRPYVAREGVRPGADLDRRCGGDGEFDLGVRTGWNGDGEPELRTVTRPLDCRPSIRCFVFGAGVGEAPAGAGGDQQPPIAGGCRCEAADDPVQPVGDGAEGVVVERGHVTGVDPAVGEQAVPAFPDGGGAHGDGVDPGRAFLLGEQLVGGVVGADAAEGVADQWGADEAGRDPVIGSPDQLDQPPPGAFPLLGAWDQVELDGQGIAGLGVAGQPSCRGEVIRVEGGADGCGQCGVAPVVLGQAKYGGNLGEEPGGVGVVGGGDQVGVGAGLVGPVGWGGGVEPVSELEAAGPADGRPRQGRRFGRPRLSCSGTGCAGSRCRRCAGTASRGPGRRRRPMRRPG